MGVCHLEGFIRNSLGPCLILSVLKLGNLGSASQHTKLGVVVGVCNLSPGEADAGRFGGGVTGPRI